MYNDEYLAETLRVATEDPDYFFVPKGISRYDYGAHAWWVRVRRDDTPFTLLFSDGVHGGIQEALIAAILYRHELLSAFPVTITKISANWLNDDPSKRITRIDEKGTAQRYIAWKAKWYDVDQKIKTKNFSVKLFGEEQAKALALEEATKNHIAAPPKTYPVYDPYIKQSFKQVLRSEVEAWASIDSNSSKDSKDELLDPFAFEGDQRLITHKSIERNSTLRLLKISTFKAKNGSVFCELCGFNFQEKYLFLSQDIIEVHHIVPLADLTEATKTQLSDLMLLCSNCHFAIHQGDAQENLAQAKKLFNQ